MRKIYLKFFQYFDFSYYQSTFWLTIWAQCGVVRRNWSWLSSSWNHSKERVQPWRYSQVRFEYYEKKTIYVFIFVNYFRFRHLFGRIFASNHMGIRSGIGCKRQNSCLSRNRCFGCREVGKCWSFDIPSPRTNLRTRVHFLITWISFFYHVDFIFLSYGFHFFHLREKIRNILNCVVSYSFFQTYFFFCFENFSK